MMKSLLFVLVGPTAVGKTEIACRVANELDCEILSADSMQVYRGMDIGTSKPTRAIRQMIPHHLIDLVEPAESFDTVQYREAALRLIPEILSRGKTPMVAGGSGLYIQVLLEGIFPGPKADQVLRQRLYEEAAASGALVLHQRLQGVDSSSAASIHPNDLRRIVRALEVYEQCQAPISQMKPNREPLDELYDIRVVGLARSRSDLYERINHRVDQIFANGLVEECRRLMDIALSQTARQALGYKEVFSYLRGEISLDECIRLVKRNTRRYAKRQMSWFRHEPRVRWVLIGQSDSDESLAREVVAKFIG
jgi:tRNA dimethylallyltransferase